MPTTSATTSPTNKPRQSSRRIPHAPRSSRSTRSSTRNAILSSAPSTSSNTSAALQRATRKLPPISWRCSPWQPSRSGCDECQQVLVAETDAEAARGAHQGAVGIDLLRRGDRLGERHVDDAAILPRDHAVGLAVGDEVDGMHAEGRRDHAVAPGRLAAALHVAEDRDARLGAGRARERFAQRMADAAIADAAGRVLALYTLAGQI